MQLQPASYNGAPFYVEVQSRGSGFRLVPHEFPKANIPWTENMGRRVRHWPVEAYLIYSPVLMPNVFQARDALIAALETPGPGVLVLPTGLQNMSDEAPGAVEVDTYTVTERRERGGWVEFAIAFVEAGQPISTQPYADTAGQVTSAAQNVQAAAASSTDLNTPAGVPAQPGAFGYPALGGGNQFGTGVAAPLGQGGIIHQ
jgi:prophage DNA circulation protein